MSFPAREQFDEEHGTALGRLYRYCRRVLLFDGNQPREVKQFPASRYARIARENVTRELDKLVADGFLIEHKREGPKRPRKFTLAYEVDRPAKSNDSPVMHSKSA